MAAVLQWLPEHVAPQKDIEWLQEVRCALEADWNDKKQGSTTEALESSIAFLPHVTRCPLLRANSIQTCDHSCLYERRDCAAQCLSSWACCRCRTADMRPSCSLRRP